MKRTYRFYSYDNREFQFTIGWKALWDDVEANQQCDWLMEDYDEVFWERTFKNN